MKFDVSHSLTGITAADYERLYVDEPFNVALCAHLGLARELVAYTNTQGRIERDVRVSPDREIPGPVAKVIGGSRISYVETLIYTLGSGVGHWSTASSILSDKITSSGSIYITQQGDAVIRRVKGHVTVKIFGLGGVVERFIVADVVRSYEQAARYTQSHLPS